MATKASLIFKFSILIISTVLLSADVDAHSFLLKPRPYIRGFNPNGCVGTNCQACPPLFKNPKLMNNTEDKPALTWSRGQRVMIRWAKNNHVGGFVRLSFVPLDRRMDVLVHDKLAFYYGCWEQGDHKCSKKQDCAADKMNQALRRRITVPDYLPDGIYIFGFLWYGGVHHSAKQSQFPDYPSCSYVRISGGKKVQASYQPFFDAGPLREFKIRHTCLTYVDEPRVCTKPDPACMGFPVYRAKPKPFQNGKKPEKIYSSYFTTDSNISHIPSPSSSLVTSITSSVRPTTTPDVIPHVSFTPSSSVSPISSAEMKPTESNDHGVCRKKICCASKCGKCARRGCASRPGGRKNCCLKHIRKNGRKCGEYAAPCNL